MCQIDKLRVRVETFQRGVFIVGIEGHKWQALVLEKLDEVDSEKTFADAAFAVEDEVELFFHRSSGFAKSMRAMRGPSAAGGLIGSSGALRKLSSNAARVSSVGAAVGGTLSFAMEAGAEAT